MSRAVVCIAPGGRLSAGAAAALDVALRGAPRTTRSLSGYLASPQASSRVLLCPAGTSLASDLAFLRRAARRLLWPAPPADFRLAIGGIRTPAVLLISAAGRPPRRRAGDTIAAFLLEGIVGPERMRAVLASGAPRDWIVESPRHVALTAERLRVLERAGIRWSALEPVEVVAIYATPGLVRARRRWRRLLPPRTPLWIREAASSRPARPRRS